MNVYSKIIFKKGRTLLRPPLFGAAVDIVEKEIYNGAYKSSTDEQSDWLHRGGDREDSHAE